MVAIRVQKGVDISTKGYKSFGMNPHHITYYNAYRFINIMKHAGDWDDFSVVDANGYPDQAGVFEAAVHSGSHDDHSGYYKISWTGDGTVSLSTGDDAWTPDSSGSNWITAWLDGSIDVASGIVITNVGSQRVTDIVIVRQEETNAANPGGVHPGWQTEYDAGQILLPDVSIKDLYETYETLRSLWWCNEPGGRHEDWSTSLVESVYSWRTILGPQNWKYTGVPYSVFIEICNQIGANPWICVPQRANDTYITNLATLVRDNLDPGLIAKFEYTNEAWNPGFKAYDCRWSAWCDGWSGPVEDTLLEWVTDFSGWTAVGCTIGGDGVTITEDASTGEHYIQTTLTYGDYDGRTLVLLLDAATAPGVRLYLYDGSNTRQGVFDLGDDTVDSSSGLDGWDGAQIRDMGAYRALWVGGGQSAGSGRIVRIQFTDAAFATSYTGTSKTLTLRRAQVCAQTTGIYPSWYAKRAAQMRDIIDTVFSATGRPYRTVFAWQGAAASSVDSAALAAPHWSYNNSEGWDENPRTWEHSGGVHDILSFATYMGNYNITGVGGVFSLTNCRELWNAWKGSGNDENATAFKAKLDGYIVAQQDLLNSFTSSYANVARTYGMGLESYEGGNHCILSQDILNPLWNVTNATGGSAASGALEFTINDTDLSFSINGDVTTGFNAAGVVKIDSEYITHNKPTFDGTRTTFVVTSDYRGERLSTAASHTAGATVTKQTYASAMPNIGTTITNIMYDTDTAAAWTNVLEHWKASGGQTWCQLTDLMVGGTGSISGWFGVRRRPGVDNDVSDAVDAFLAANPRWWIN